MTTPNQTFPRFIANLFLLCLVSFLVFLMVLAMRTGWDKSELMHKQNLCASAHISGNVDYLNRCKDWGME